MPAFNHSTYPCSAKGFNLSYASLTSPATRNTLVNLRKTDPTFGAQLFVSPASVQGKYGLPEDDSILEGSDEGDINADDMDEDMRYEGDGHEDGTDVLEQVIVNRVLGYAVIPGFDVIDGKIAVEDAARCAHGR